MFFRFLSNVAALCLLAMMTVTMADAVGRYFLDLPIHGASEIVAYLLGYTVFCALPGITREKGHIEVGIFAPKLPPALRRWEARLTVALTIGGFAFVCWMLFKQALRMSASGVFLGYFDVPAAPLIYPLAALAGVTAIVALMAVRARRDSAHDS